jgi:hypothetical protein
MCQCCRAASNLVTSAATGRGVSPSSPKATSAARGRLRGCVRGLHGVARSGFRWCTSHQTGHYRYLSRRGHSTTVGHRADTGVVGCQQFPPTDPTRQRLFKVCTAHASIESQSLLGRQLGIPSKTVGMTGSAGSGSRSWDPSPFVGCSDFSVSTTHDRSAAHMQSKRAASHDGIRPPDQYLGILWAKRGDRECRTSEMRLRDAYKVNLFPDLFFESLHAGT